MKSIAYSACCLLLACLRAAAADAEISARAYGSIQEAIDANPGKPIYVPAGDYPIAKKLRLHTNGGGLFGPGRIIQTSDNEPIIEIERANGVRLRELTLTRSEEKRETRNEGVLAINCRDLSLEDLSVIDNCTLAAAISLRDCDGARIRGCLVRNYMRVSVDDRTASPNYGYAFKCIDGTGINVNSCRNCRVEGNRVIEERLLPTPEIQRQLDLGKFTKKNATKGPLISQQSWDEEHVNIWHQGSAIVINGPETGDRIQLLGNSIENAAQGIDIHADHVTVANNIIDNAFIGMKAMHGSRHTLIIGNQFMRNDLWSIGLMPGAASHPAVAGEKPIPPNVDGGSIIANNIISDFGRGHAHWVWSDQGTPIRFDSGQMPDDPPLADVVVQGNVIYNTERDEAPAGGPLYKFAVRMPKELQGMHFIGNIFHPGREGVSNTPLPP